MQLISSEIQSQMAGSSWIRRMFEKGIELKKQFGAENVFDFSLGNPDIPPPSCAPTHCTGWPSAWHVHLVWVLPQLWPAGVPRSIGGISERAATGDGAGRAGGGHLRAAGALTSFFRAVLEPGDEVLCPAPYFVEYGSYCGHFGGVLKAIPSLPPDFQPDIAAIEAAVTERTRVLLINSPNNPTGCVYSQRTLTALLSWSTASTLHASGRCIC